MLKRNLPQLGTVGALLASALLLLATQTASAATIDEIDIPITGATYNVANGDFTISGRPSSDVAVFYNDGSTPNPVRYGFVIFNLSTIGMDSTVSADGSSIQYDANGSVGDLSMLDGDDGFSVLFQAELVSLSLDIIDAGLGAFAGSGSFLVSGGSLADDFGAEGGVTSIGISFTVPVDFNSSFAALANIQLGPGAGSGSGGGGDPTIPEPAAALVFGIGLLLIRQRLERQG